MTNVFARRLCGSVSSGLTVAMIICASVVSLLSTITSVSNRRCLLGEMPKPLLMGNDIGRETVETVQLLIDI
jgi:hypothetical protein